MKNINCDKCNYEFTYSNLLTTIRTIACPSCGNKYKVEAKSINILITLIAIGILSIQYIDTLIPSTYQWLSFTIVVSVLFLLAPLNQRLELIDSDENN